MSAPNPAANAEAIARELANGALGVIVLDDTIADCNDRFCRMLGCGREHVIGRTFLELCPEVQSDGAFSRERWQRRWHAARAGLPQWFPWQFRGGEGTRVHGLVHLDARGAAETLVAKVHDLTGMAEADWVSPDVHARAQQVLDHAKAVVFVKDREGRYLFANRELERAVRTPAQRIVGYTDHEIWQSEIAERFRLNDAQVLREKRAMEFEVTATVARQVRTFVTFKFPLLDSSGELYGICGIATDITERKRTQDALTRAALAVSSAQGASVLQELVRYLATILEADGALISGPQEDASPARMRVHAFYLDGSVEAGFDYDACGTPCEKVVGQSFRIYPANAREQFPNDPEFHRLGIESYAGFPLTDGAGGSLGLIAIISRRPMVNAEFIESILKIFAVRAAAELERQRAEATLRRSEASYRAIFEASEDAVFIHDYSGRIIDVNRRACEIYGYTLEELKNVRVADVSSGEYPYTAAEAAKKLAEAKAGKTVRMEWHRRNKDGSLHWDEVVVRSATIAGEPRLIAFTREITERKRAEQALRQAQKMEALGHLTGGIAHDFNNLLTSIMGYIVLAADHPAAGRDAKLEKYLEHARSSCVRARDLIQQMLTFSRGKRGQPRPVALAPLVVQSVKLFGSSLPSTLEVETHIEEDVAPVMLDPVHLDQILLNLCLNACDAMSGIGTIRVSVSRSKDAEHVCTACRQTASGEFVQLCVEDDGPGIAPDILDRIFEPFFTTKDVGKGSGMGLASVHGIVHELGGHIVVDTAAGRGTRFCVLLPALDDAGAPDLAPAVRRQAARVELRGHVLVVDDDQSVGTFMRALLESWGLSVTVASSAAEAISIVTQGLPELDLVVTDQMMPRTTGIELTLELARIRPDIPVILYTGHAESVPTAESEAAGVRAILTKPVDPHALFGLLQTHLPARSLA